MASQHGKDRCCRLAFRLGLGLQLTNAEGIDTDRLGTFWIKGLQSWDKLPETFPQLLATDMRAHLNPARRQVIRRLSLELVRRMRRLCPKCLHPGYGVTGQRRGLPCETCRCPTAWIAQEIWECLACGQKATEMRRDGITEAPASDCLVCNP